MIFKNPIFALEATYEVQANTYAQRYALREGISTNWLGNNITKSTSKPIKNENGYGWWIWRKEVNINRDYI